MKLCIFTIVARNYLPLALTLADSVRTHHPGVDFRIVVVDGLDGLPEQGYSHRLVALDDYLDDSFEPLKFKYNITEFCTSVKAHLFLRLLEETKADYCYYLDPDTWLFAPLDAIHSQAPGASVYLTPHLLHCQVDADHAYPEYKHLWEGIFNLGFCAVRSSPAALNFLQWWDKRLRESCYADHFDGLHTDQKWMDYAPAYLGDQLHILRLQGVNVAHWNLDERCLTEHGTGWQINGEPLILFHFSGFDFAGELLTRHAEPQRQQHYDSQALRKLAASYRQAVLSKGYAAHISIPYAFGRFNNGDAVTPLHRRLYRALGAGQWDQRPFAAQSRLHRALADARLMDNSPAAQRSHAAATLPSLGRLTKIAHRTLKLFLKLFGAARYAYLLKFFGKFSRPEQHVFLLETGPASHPNQKHR
ncbi:hypothetical protein RQP53_18420 [Paucibacter sp. APW11]|uniref:Glycosyl transferase n=1 Tax=Roseateles aquae TaxID=3077235 RepID=A0ABU3PF72_9BURK|nr:hypothetical protein [Paucibacter sp. APW11]MDT9001260.1 hypothetical protein [Paucibacter sp. APW11]